MTKAEAVSQFNELWKNKVNLYPHIMNDDAMKSEDWNNYTNMLCKNGVITEKQYNSWDSPA
jgi:Na+-transporting NADH:ubiquinone oxidoreductase subunit NqrF